MEDEAKLYAVSAKRRIRFSFEQPLGKVRQLGVHRRWLRNPVLVACESAQRFAMNSALRVLFRPRIPPTIVCFQS